MEILGAIGKGAVAALSLLQMAGFLVGIGYLFWFWGASAWYLLCLLWR